MTDPIDRVLRANEHIGVTPGYWPETPVWFDDVDEAELQFIECLEKTDGKGPCTPPVVGEIKGP